ncbi:MAG: sulfur oxidation c-type cytochrome SoxX [Thiohalomonadaceae bacterium]
MGVGYLRCAWMIGLAAANTSFAGDYVSWRAEGLAIEQPLAGLRGDPARGRAVVIARDRGNCLACHMLPIPEEPAHGTVGPPLMGVGARLSAAELRLRVVDEKQVNPESIMPSFYLHPSHLHRPRPDMAGTILTAQEVEDVVAYLSTLR